MTYEALARQLEPDELKFDEATRAAHAGDKWFASHMPDAVALPNSVESVINVMRFAHAHGIPVTARGAGHGYVGGCVPVNGGIVISLARLNRIVEIHRGDFVAIVEAGVVTANLQKAVERMGLFYPPDPASRDESTIGGNIATNAGGPRCLKYGVTRDYVLGLDVVLADGTFVKLGGRTHKNKTGFDLARLFVGSEGMLGVITRATLKLIPRPPHRACLAAGFGSARDAARAIGRIFRAGFLPCALEVADAFTLEAARKRTGNRKLFGCDAHLIVEVDGQEQSVRNELKELITVVKSVKPRFVDCAFGTAACERIWKVRREFSYALRDTGLTKLNEDIAIPRSRLEDLFAFAEELQRKHGLMVACFGHAGDGNIHVNVMVDMTQKDAKARSTAALNDLFERVLSWGGTITGEHGVGLAKKPWWALAVPEEVRHLHSRIKNALDPKGILNPGKFI